MRRYHIAFFFECLQDPQKKGLFPVKLIDDGTGTMKRACEVGGKEGGKKALGRRYTHPDYDGPDPLVSVC
jgi:hypothetical protein